MLSYVIYIVNMSNILSYERGKEPWATGLSQKYNVDRLVYYEACATIIVAIERKINHEINPCISRAV